MALRRTAQLLLAATSVTQICASPHGLVPRQNSLPIESCPGYKASNVQQTVQGIRQGLTVSTGSLSNHPLLLTMILGRPYAQWTSLQHLRSRHREPEARDHLSD
jgi:hypothetical protein